MLISKIVMIVLAVAALLILGIIDHVTGYHVQISFLYLLPIILAGFMIGRRMAYLMAVLSAFTWLVVDIMSEVALPHPLIHVWNLVLRMTFFLLVTYGISMLAIMQRRQQELSDFVVHDLKAPLTNILLGAQLAGDTSGGLPERTKRMIDMSLVSAQNMLSLVNSLVDLSKMEAHRFMPKTEDVAVEGVVDKSIEQVSLWAESSGINIVKEVRVSKKVIQSDYWLLLRIMINILSNSLKFSPNGSTIAVSVKEDGGVLRFEIADQGEGMEPRAAEKIFDKYYQSGAKSHGKAPLPGSGIGLTFCKMAVESLGGHIWVKSEKGRGTVMTFTVKLVAHS